MHFALGSFHCQALALLLSDSCVRLSQQFKEGCSVPMLECMNLDITLMLGSVPQIGERFEADWAQALPEWVRYGVRAATVVLKI